MLGISLVILRIVPLSQLNFPSLYIYTLRPFHFPPLFFLVVKLIFAHAFF